MGERDCVLSLLHTCLVASPFTHSAAYLLSNSPPSPPPPPPSPFLTGESLPGDAELLGESAGSGGKGRDTWMTELPPERKVRAGTSGSCV